MTASPMTASRKSPPDHRRPLKQTTLLRAAASGSGRSAHKAGKRQARGGPGGPLRHHTRKSTEHGLDLEFNSLDAQREACEAYIKSQASEGWQVIPDQYNDPAYSGGNMDRPALQRILKDIEAGLVDVVVVYKINRLRARSPTLRNWSRSSMQEGSRSLRSRSNSTQPPPWAGDAECAPVVRPVRARARLERDQGQGRRLPQEGQMDRRQRPARL